MRPATASNATGSLPCTERRKEPKAAGTAHISTRAPQLGHCFPVARAGAAVLRQTQCRIGGVRTSAEQCDLLETTRHKLDTLTRLLCNHQPDCICCTSHCAQRIACFPVPADVEVVAAIGDQLTIHNKNRAARQDLYWWQPAKPCDWLSDSVCHKLAWLC